MKLKSSTALVFIGIMMPLLQLLLAPSAGATTPRVDAALASPEADFLLDLYSQSPDSLYSRGMYYARHDSIPDRAMVAFTMLGNNYDKAKTPHDREMAIKGLAEKAYAYYFQYFDYSKAFETIAQAETLMDKHGFVIPEIYIYQGLFHCSLAEQIWDKATMERAIDFFLKGLDVSDPERDRNLINMAFCNAITQAYVFDIPVELEDSWKKFVKTYEGKGNEYTRFTELNYFALEAMKKGDTATAHSYFDEMINLMPKDSQHARYSCGAWEYKAILYKDNGDYQRALECLEEFRKLADRFEVNDAKVQLYQLQSEIYTALGKKELALDARAHSLEVKDSLVSYQQIRGIGESSVITQMARAEKEIREMKEKRSLMIVVIVCIAVLMLAAGVFIFMMVRKNRELKSSNRSLLDQHREIAEADKRELQVRAQYERQLEALRESLPQPAEEPTAEEAIEEEDAEEEGVFDEKDYDDDEESGKGRTSRLSEHTKNKLMTRILDVMENQTEAICEVDFTVKSLAELVGARYKLVSRVINECHGCNFNTFLNKYRIREACHRLSDPDTYGNPTMDVLSFEVGFKSRSTFVVQFKKFTGLTPSQFVQSAKA